jgi:hypothetical protein
VTRVGHAWCRDHCAHVVLLQKLLSHVALRGSPPRQCQISFEEQNWSLSPGARPEKCLFDARTFSAKQTIHSWNLCSLQAFQPRIYLTHIRGSLPVAFSRASERFGNKLNGSARGCLRSIYGRILGRGKDPVFLMWQSTFGAPRGLPNRRVPACPPTSPVAMVSAIAINV